MATISRQESQDRTQQCLRDAAAVEFARYGIAGASTDRITEAACYSRGAFYANYGSKHELALELLAANNAQSIAQWRTLIDESLDVPTLVQCLEQLFDLAASERQWWLLAGELRLEAERNLAFAEAFDAVNDQIRQQLLEMIRSLCRATGWEATADRFISPLSFTRSVTACNLSGLGHPLPPPALGNSLFV
ncbi:MAG TPA: TetR/AcrR family transcriptional regulator [Pseudomonas sp.]|jgi:AcrR family transcriptional regulator